MDHHGRTEGIEMPPGLSFDQKWAFLKSHIERLYVHEKYKLGHIIEIMKGQCGFYATYV
jgi:Clr5 domain